ncbi:FAD-dependent oxidoreductase [Candidatus Marsarchaeota archaeon]|jgi:malate dehydrogenase (quinone)|nr:FAD-dependent oxidoreductase [Candidatus Marsarchaeota archaeon]MCL5092751.1 FAD-dependent oxidoreductase [Candidatus Marsarchaeota archaeon]
MDKNYDIIIVGGGITGAALLYTLSNYTNTDRILLIEKYDTLAKLNSNSINNSQTLHFGDIETNYTYEKAKETKATAERVLNYTSMLPRGKRKGLLESCQKMVLGVGEEEIEALEKIYASKIKELFPGLKALDKKEISTVEPNVTYKRDPKEKIFALISDKGYMVDYGKLTLSYIENSFGKGKANTHILFDTAVKKVKKSPDGYTVFTDKHTFNARFVIFASGTYSLFFAKSMGYDKNLSILSVGGNFYISKRVLRGKVYRVQKGGIPFAAIHGDPDITNPAITRFGPTVTLPIQLERRHNGTSLDYIRTFDFDAPTISSLFKILLNKDIRRIIRKNMLYSAPVIGQYLFLKNEASVIVPSLRYSNLTFAGNVGGIRPQIIDENKRALSLGASKIKGDGIIFNVTPSPGATSALSSALEDALYVSKSIGLKFYREKYESILGPI